MVVRIFGLISLTIAVSACLVGPVTHWKPSAPNAEYYLSSGCAGPKDKAVLSGPEGIMIAIKVSSSYGSDIDVDVYVPETLPVSVQFTSGTFLLTDELSKVVHEYRPGYVFDGLGTTPKMKYRDIGEPLSGKSRKVRQSRPQQWFGKTIDHAPYQIELHFSVRSKHFKLRIPPLIVGAQTVQFPDVEIQEVTEWIVTPFNC